MNQPQSTLTVSAHGVAIPPIKLKVSVGDIDDTRLCIYNYLKE